MYHALLNFLVKHYMYVCRGNQGIMYKTWMIYLVMEYTIGFPMQLKAKRISKTGMGK